MIAYYIKFVWLGNVEGDSIYSIYYIYILNLIMCFLNKTRRKTAKNEGEIVEQKHMSLV